MLGLFFQVNSLKISQTTLRAPSQYVGKVVRKEKSMGRRPNQLSYAPILHRTSMSSKVTYSSLLPFLWPTLSRISSQQASILPRHFERLELAKKDNQTYKCVDLVVFLDIVFIQIIPSISKNKTPCALC